MKVLILRKAPDGSQDRIIENALLDMAVSCASMTESTDEEKSP